jgi:hypothetical protein
MRAAASAHSLAQAAMRDAASAEAKAAAAQTAEAAAEAKAAAAEARASSPDEAKRVAYRAFVAAEAWRVEQAALLYANMSAADWDAATRWKSYAQPDAPERTCGGAASPPADLLADILLLHRAVAAAAPLANRSRGVYLALHAFHTTGLEGNTLTLPETLLTIAGQPLFAGFDARVLPTPSASLSATEALNVALLWSALDLASLAGRSPPPLDLAALSVRALEDLNSAITRDTGTPAGLRRRAVALGHQRVLLPMPDEEPALVHELLAWLAAELAQLAAVDGGGGGGGDAALARALALACDAHTRFVFIHPFADGNGRTARTLAGLVLQRVGLPAPMIPRELRAEYMAAVSGATGTSRSYAPLALLHAQAVRRSLACQLALARMEPEAAAAAAAAAPPTDAGAAAALAAALERSDCALHLQQPASAAA